MIRFWNRGPAYGLAGAAAAAGVAVSAGSAIASSGAISGGQSAADAAQEGALGNYSANEAPYIGAGTNALSSLADADGLNGATGNANALSNFQASPGYQYQLQQGLSAVDNGAASTGTLRSGNTIRAEETLGSNLANQDYSAYLGRLNSLASLGQTATSALGGAQISTGAGEASTATSGAAAQAGIDAGTAKAIGGAANTAANALSGTSSSAGKIASQTGTTGVNISSGALY